jgi:hypothetical protein
MEKITLQIDNDGSEMNTSFIGQWLVGDADKGVYAGDDDGHWNAGPEWTAAITQKGALVVYTHSNGVGNMEIHDSFEDLRDHANEASPAYPANVIAAVARAVGEQYEIELDIWTWTNSIWLGENFTPPGLRVCNIHCVSDNVVHE